MTKYVALLRGIMPSNPNMSNENLRRLFEELGFANVRTVIASGNVLFETNSKMNVARLEMMIEQSLPERLGFRSTTILRSLQQLQALAKEDPFEGIQDTPQSRLNVTFLKDAPKRQLTFPFSPEKKSYTLVGYFDQAICSVMDTTSSKTPDLMVWLDKQFGKEITTRTWKTVHRILAKMS